MAYDVTTTPASGDDTQLADYVRLRDSIKSLGSAGEEHDMGGSLLLLCAETAFVTLYNSWEAGKEIDGTELAGRTVVLEMDVIAALASAVTVNVRLYNVTDAAAVASADIATALAGTAPVFAKSGALTLASGLKKYRIEIKGSVGSANPVGARARVVIR